MSLKVDSINEASLLSMINLITSKKKKYYSKLGPFGYMRGDEKVQ